MTWFGRLGQSWRAGPGGETSMAQHFLLLVLVLLQILHQAFAASTSSLLPLDRTLDLSSLGIDFNAIFDRLLSPKGIVQQFALTLVTVVFRSIGWATFGLGYGALVERASPGPLLDLLTFFEVVLTPQVGLGLFSSLTASQAIATSLVRDLLRIVWELAGRVVTTTLLFGVFESFSQVVANTSVDSLWSFLSSSQLKELMSLRFHTLHQCHHHSNNHPG